MSFRMGDVVQILPSQRSLEDLVGRAFDNLIGYVTGHYSPTQPYVTFYMPNATRSTFCLFDCELSLIDRFIPSSGETFEAKPCTCTITTLMRYGCTCGSIPLHPGACPIS